MADPAVFVADDGERSRLVRRHFYHMLIARYDLYVDVDGLQRKTVVVVHRGQMQSISLVLLEFQDRPPIPETRDEINVAARRRMHHRDFSVSFRAYGVFV